MPKLQFSADIEDSVDDFSQLPEGWYKGSLDNSYFQDFKNGNGVALVLDFIITNNNGPTRRLKSFNTWRHTTSTEAEKWGQVAIKQFMRACGKAGAESTEECHNIPIEILVKEGEKYNQIKGYRRGKTHSLPGVKVFRTERTIPEEAIVTHEQVSSHAAKFADDEIPF